MARENVSDNIIDSGNVITAKIESIAAGGGGEEAEQMHHGRVGTALGFDCVHDGFAVATEYHLALRPAASPGDSGSDECVELVERHGLSRLSHGDCAKLWGPLAREPLTTEMCSVAAAAGVGEEFEFLGGYPFYLIQ